MADHKTCPSCGWVLHGHARSEALTCDACGMIVPRGLLPDDPSSKLKIVDTDLMSSRSEAVVNAVNTVGVMGKGVALLFKKKYPDYFSSYAKACRSGTIRIGSVFEYELGSAGPPSWILSVPTKRHWRDPSGIADVERGVEALWRSILHLKIGSVSVPALGCGEGGLSFSRVGPILVKYLSSLSCEVFIHMPR